MLDEEEGCAESIGGKSLRWRLTEGYVTMVLAGCATSMGGTAGERKAARGASSVMTGAGRLENRVERVEGAVTLLEEIQGAKDVDGHSNDAYHQAIGGGHADSMKEGLEIDSVSARNFSIQSMEDGYRDRDKHERE
ncbi:uncharacterized protein DS421_8g244220 [Arachis hypogaea]|nr:uncharacterized protein DS421_8g244220 [Arachis hypogaea]